MAHDRRPRSLGLFGLLLAASATAGVGIMAQTPVTPAGEVTFTKDIAPILQRSCQECHHADGVAPMSLVTYEDVRPWAQGDQDAHRACAASAARCRRSSSRRTSASRSSSTIRR